MHVNVFDHPLGLAGHSRAGNGKHEQDGDARQGQRGVQLPTRRASAE
ncbi:hypothetical protein NMD1_02018 [Novosphingobium sp. MD-1]|nr:hypothetical protein NMD1_02018 [Novosphingobium sp. MD-1]